MLRGGESGGGGKTKDELEEEIVLEILREGRGEREEKGERDEWNQHVGWHRKENVGQVNDNDEIHTPPKGQDKDKDKHKHTDPASIRHTTTTKTARDHGKLRNRNHKHAEPEKNYDGIQSTTILPSHNSFRLVVPFVFLGLVWWNSTRIRMRNMGRRKIRNRNTKGRTL